MSQRAQPEPGPDEPLTIARPVASACEQPDRRHVMPGCGARLAAVTIAAAYICYLVSPRWRDSGECDATSRLRHWGQRPKSRGPVPGLPKPVATAARSSALRPSTSGS